MYFNERDYFLRHFIKDDKKFNDALYLAVLDQKEAQRITNEIFNSNKKSYDGTQLIKRIKKLVLSKKIKRESGRRLWASIDTYDTIFELFELTGEIDQLEAILNFENLKNYRFEDEEKNIIPPLITDWTNSHYQLGDIVLIYNALGVVIDRQTNKENYFLKVVIPNSGTGSRIIIWSENAFEHYRSATETSLKLVEAVKNDKPRDINHGAAILRHEQKTLD